MIFNLFGTGIRSKSPIVTAQRRLNCFYEIIPDEDKTKVAIYGTPGLTLWETLTNGVCRGGVTSDGIAYLVSFDKLYSLTPNKVLTELGTLNTSTGKVGMAFDNNVVMIVDGVNGYTYTFATAAFAQITDGDFPNGCQTVTWLGGFFAVEDGDSFFISENGTDWDALDFAQAEAAPDGIRRVFELNSQLLLLGDLTTEFWAITTADFPFAPIGGSTIELGIFAKWSAQKVTGGMVMLARHPEGQAQVVLIRGYEAIPISSQDLETVINEYETINDATALAYKYKGHTFYQLNFPTEGKSWLYDFSTQLWSEKAYSSQESRDRAEIFLRLANKTLVTDYENGNVYEVDGDAYTDNGEEIAREIVGRHFFAGEDYITIGKLQLDMETGVGVQSGQGSDPQIMLQISRDGGRTYGNELWRSLGAVGKYLTQVIWRSLGQSRDWIFKIRMTDPVKFAIANAIAEAETDS